MPISANRSAAARPMPLAAPVITATLLRSNGVAILAWYFSSHAVSIAVKDYGSKASLPDHNIRSLDDSDDLVTDAECLGSSTASFVMEEVMILPPTSTRTCAVVCPLTTLTIRPFS